MNSRKLNPQRSQNVNIILMPILYRVIPNQLDKKNNSFIPLAVSEFTVNHNELIQRIVKSTSLSKFELTAAYEALFAETQQILREGKTVNTQWFNAKCHPKGVLKDKDDLFNHVQNPDHKIQPHIHFTKEFKRKLDTGSIRVRKLSQLFQMPEMHNIIDAYSEIENSLRIGKLALINGKNFSIKDGEELEISLINESDEEFTIKDIVIISDQKIKFELNTDIAAGNYILMLSKKDENNTEVVSYKKLLTIS
ncbi:MAG: DNA-binding domain-containing protein [Hyphomicrobiales bacterium]